MWLEFAALKSDAQRIFVRKGKKMPTMWKLAPLSRRNTLLPASCLTSTLQAHAAFAHPSCWLGLRLATDRLHHEIDGDGENIIIVKLFRDYGATHTCHTACHYCYNYTS